MSQNWILNKETGRFELAEDVQSDRNKTKQKALFDYNIERVEGKRSD